MKIQKVENIDLESVRKLIAEVSEYDVLPKFNTQGKEARIQIISATVMDWRRGEASC